MKLLPIPSLAIEGVFVCEHSDVQSMSSETTQPVLHSAATSDGVSHVVSVCLFRSRRKEKEKEAPNGVNSNENSHNTELVKAVLVAGLYPNIVKIEMPPPPPEGRGGRKGRLSLVSLRRFSKCSK